MTKVDDPPNAPAVPAPPARDDVVFVHSPSEDGRGLRVVRKREDSIELGEIRAVEEGKPLHGDLVRLKQRKEHERLFDVEVLVEHPRAQLQEGSRSGPAQVATDAYRSNWDAIFGARTSPDDDDSLN